MLLNLEDPVSPAASKLQLHMNGSLGKLAGCNGGGPTGGKTGGGGTPAADNHQTSR